MNGLKKVFPITVLGLLMVLFVYPLLHECGHSLLAIILGADILELELWPHPHVLCNMKNLSSTSQVTVGAGGMLLPILISACIPQKRFWVWYCNMILIGIETLSVVISLAALISFDLGHPIANEDMTTMLTIAPSAQPLFFVLTLSLLCGLIGLTITKRPLTKLKTYLLN